MTPALWIGYKDLLAYFGYQQRTSRITEKIILLDEMRLIMLFKKKPNTSWSCDFLGHETAPFVSLLLGEGIE